MDTVTQMLFGGVLGQAAFRERLGRRAMAAGAAVALLPDLDVVAGWSGGAFASWQHHRALTHSLFFAPLAGPLIGWGLWRLERWWEAPPDPDRKRLRAWIWLSMLALVTHPLIDLFTSYGTQLLWPLTTTRFAIDSMPIIDPLYSLILIVALLVGVFFKRRVRLAQDVGAAALFLVFVYTFAGWAINERIRQVAEADFGRPAIVSAYPQLFQPFYRRVVAVTPEAAHVGYYSILNPRPIAWSAHPAQTDGPVEAVRGTREAAIFEWFSMGKVLWRSRPGENGASIVEGTDLRYGMRGPTNLGFWGVRASVNGDNSLAGPVEAFRVPREASGAALRQYWADITGW